VLPVGSGGVVPVLDLLDDLEGVTPSAADHILDLLPGLVQGLAKGVEEAHWS
jgi:hypothetical protein